MLVIGMLCINIYAENQAHTTATAHTYKDTEQNLIAKKICSGEK